MNGLTHHTAGRWLKAFGTSDTLQTKAESVRDITLDIRQLCNELLDKNVHHIKNSNLSITMSNMRKISSPANRHNANRNV